MRNLSISLLLCAGALLAGCGSSSSSSTAGSTGSSAANSKFQAGVAFATCMRAHGVPNFPDPGTGEGGGLQIQSTPGHTEVNGVAVNGPAFQGALQSCRSKLPNGGHPPPLTAARKAAMLHFSQCMRAHGLTGFPDPTFATGGAQLRIDRASGLNPASPVFQAAQRACGSFIQRAKLGP
jgi:uncharacterized protein YceK